MKEERCAKSKCRLRKYGNIKSSCNSHHIALFGEERLSIATKLPAATISDIFRCYSVTRRSEIYLPYCNLLLVVEMYLIASNSCSTQSVVIRESGNKLQFLSLCRQKGARKSDSRKVGLGRGSPYMYLPVLDDACYAGYSCWNVDLPENFEVIQFTPFESCDSCDQMARRL